ncbi:MAG: hypothetical protein NTZ09_04940 [Candidatus Hydrogenedentes bacterium]|nr:hypothetical protein [Candidatus Hydrogenedentota bacterium]
MPADPALIVMEAEAYAELVQPMRVARGDSTASGDAWVELPLGSGKGWRGKGGGRAAYRVDVPAAGRYAVWARAWWKDGCSNALFLQANDSPTLVFGNDAVFGQWHWVCSPSLQLGKGLNYIRFSNHSDGVRIDKLAVTNDVFYYPEGLADEITHFFDGFAGCDADNTGSWSFPAGRWRVVRNPGGTSAALGDCLAQFDSGGGAARAGNPLWHDYDVRVKTMLTGPGTVGVIFYQAGENDFCRLSWELNEVESALSLEQVSAGRTKVLCRQTLEGMTLDTWYDLAVTTGGGVVRAAMDGTESCRVDFECEPKGRVGLSATVSGAFFDNVEVVFKHEK